MHLNQVSPHGLTSVCRFTKYPLDGLYDSFILRGLQSSEFSPESAKEKLVNLQLNASSKSTAQFSAGIANYDDDASCEESVVFKSMRCGGSINLNSQVSVRKFDLFSSVIETDCT